MWGELRVVRECAGVVAAAEVSSINLHVLSKQSKARSSGPATGRSSISATLIGPGCTDGASGSLLYGLFSPSRACFSSLHYTHHGTVYCSTNALNYALALYCVSESTKPCTVAG